MSDYVLQHYGIKGQKWGVRRFQNEDGTRTEAGRKRYNLKEKAKNYGQHHRDVTLKRRERDRYAKEIAKKDSRNARAEASAFLANVFQDERMAAVANYQHEEIRRDAKEKADRMIAKKYGDKALKDVRKRDVARGAEFIAGFSGLMAASIYAMDRSTRR